MPIKTFQRLKNESRTEVSVLDPTSTRAPPHLWHQSWVSGSFQSCSQNPQGTHVCQCTLRAGCLSVRKTCFFRHSLGVPRTSPVPECAQTREGSHDSQAWQAMASPSPDLKLLHSQPRSASSWCPSKWGSSLCTALLLSVCGLAASRGHSHLCTVVLAPTVLGSRFLPIFSMPLQLDALWIILFPLMKQREHLPDGSPA